MAFCSVKKVDVEVELKSPVDKLWNAQRESATLFPRVFPDIYSNIQILEGDGKSVGSVRLINYVKGKSAITCAKERIEYLDDDAKALSYNVIDGDILKLYKYFKCNLAMVPKGDGSVVKWSCQFEIISEKAPCPHTLKDFAIKNFRALDVYLLKI